MSKETVTIEVKGVPVDTDNDAMTVQEFVPMFTRAVSAVRLPVVRRLRPSYRLRRLRRRA